MAIHINRGVVPVSVKACVYGPEGVGKTTFASEWPGAVILDVEDGSTFYDMARIYPPRDWDGLLATVREAANVPEIGTLVIDTADAAEAICVSHLLKKHNRSGIEDFGYGKGYTYLAEEFSKLLAALNEVAAAEKNVLVVAHATIRKFEQPDELGAYDRWELKLSRKCAPLVKEWADLLLFANFKTDVMVDQSTGKARATGGKRRIMYASHSAAYDAKNRFGLPDEMEFDFSSISHVVPGGEIPSVEPAPAPAVKVQPWVDSSLFKRLDTAMRGSGVKPDELRRAVGSRASNPYTAETPISAYDEAFVVDVLMAHWDAIVATVEDMRQGTVEVIDVPFN